MSGEIFVAEYKYLHMCCHFGIFRQFQLVHCTQFGRNFRL